MNGQRYEPAFPLVDLVEHPDNPRRGDEAAIEASMTAHGFYGAVLVQASSSRLIAGNHRARVARRLGHATVPAIVLDVDDDQARRLLLVDNRTQDLAGYDSAVLDALLADLAASAGGLDGTGYDLELEYDASLEGSTASDTWLTPLWVFEALGLAFDLDPAAAPAGDNVPAAERWTTGGLERTWHGLVWCCPPFSQTASWLERFVAHGAGVALVPFSNSRAMRAAWARPDIALCWPDRDFPDVATAFPVVALSAGPVAAAALGRLGPTRNLPESCQGC